VQLLNNDILLAAVLVDPPIWVLQNKDQKTIKKHALCHLAMKIKGLESETSQSEFTDKSNTEADRSSSSSKDHDLKK